MMMDGCGLRAKTFAVQIFDHENYGNSGGPEQAAFPLKHSRAPFAAWPPEALLGPVCQSSQMQPFFLLHAT
jgi:hypothetical protein